MIVALFLASQVIYLTSPPVPSPWVDTGRRFTNFEACRQAAEKSAVSGWSTMCSSLPGMI